MAWVDSTRVDRLLGSTTLRQKLFALDGTYDANVFAQYEAEARAKIVSYLLYAGYSSPGATVDTTTDGGAFLAGLCSALMCHNAFAKAKGIAWPAGLRESTDQAIADLQAIYDKKLPVPGLTADGVAGYGGISVSSTSETEDAGRPQRFSRAQLRRW